MEFDFKGGFALFRGDGIGREKVFVSLRKNTCEH